VNATAAVVDLLAERLRVEERQLMAAFAARGWEARLVELERQVVPLQDRGDAMPPLALERRVVTHERATLAALLAAGGSVVVNRTATARLLADRLALLRHLILAGIATPQTSVAFGAEATLAAIEQLGYPVLLQSLTVEPNVPDAVVADQDAAEAIVEHRTTLGKERAVLVQRYIPAPGGKVRIVVAGTSVAGTERVQRASSGATYEPYDNPPAGIRALGERLIARLGSGAYEVHVIDGDEPVVIGAGNLIDFRSLSERGIDVASAIADFALCELEQRGTHERGA
jgi:[lysine-biosynthesis-protein LysW]--L-2-aminoadipate ligase